MPARPEIVEQEPLVKDVVAKPIPDVEAQLNEMIRLSNQRLRGIMIGNSPKGYHDVLDPCTSLFDGPQPQSGAECRLADVEDREKSDPCQRRFEPDLVSIFRPDLGAEQLQLEWPGLIR